MRPPSMKNSVSRRSLVGVFAASGVSGIASSAMGAPLQSAELDAAVERGLVIQSGLTEAEADCWVAVAQAAGKFFDLPELHPMDEQEVAQAIHVIQNKLLSRPTYRKYKSLPR